MSLGQKVLSGFFWTLLSNIGNKLITLVIGVILARLLFPEDFGLVAMLYIFFEVSQSLINSGFGQALIREDTLTEKDKGTVFFINLAISIACYAILFFTAPLIADFYDNQILIDLTRFMGFSIVFSALVIVQRASLTHELAFKKLMIVNVVTNVLTGVIGIVLAYYGYGVWALAIKYVAQAFFMSSIFFVINPWVPKNFISKESFNRLFGFGSKLLLSGLLNTVYGNIYKLIIGKYYTAVSLGLFTQAQLYVNQVTQSAVGTIQTVTYPILSKAKDDPARLKNAYRKIIMASSYVIFPLVIGLGILAEPFILTLVGQKWIGVLPFLQILCLSGALYHLHSINLNILQVMGRSDLFLKLEVIKKINITIAIIIGLQFGIWGLMIGQVASSYIALLINMYYTNRFLNYNYREQFKDLLPIIAYTLPMLGLLIILQKFTDFSAILELIIGVLSGTVTYLGTTYLAKATALSYILELLSNRYTFFKRLNI
jgi:O-antigen/teichoic acid export membrane protein